ncbi:MAG: MBL fold metallo-hydrolase [Terricaulis sp.]
MFSLISTLFALGGCASIAPPTLETCWIEYSAGDAPATFAAADLATPIWHSTTSGLLIRHRRGHVLVDAGWSHAVAEETNELPEPGRSMSIRILNSAAWRRWTPEALASANEDPASLAMILPTHAHFDHMAGAEDIAGVHLLLNDAETAFLDEQLRAPTIVSPSNIRALRDRVETFSFENKGYLGFRQSFDVFDDDAIVVVPLPGHTPGSIGVFTNVAGRRVFLVGDAALISEAVERGLPKVDPLRGTVENDPEQSDRTVAVLAAFHAAHPDVLVIPSHDRTAWQSAFGEAPSCASAVGG